MSINIDEYRSYPEIGYEDTMYCNLDTGEFRSMHRNTPFIQTNEIFSLKAAVKGCYQLEQKPVGDIPFYKGKNSDNSSFTLLQQQGRSACVPATGAMILKDACRKFRKGFIRGGIFEALDSTYLMSREDFIDLLLWDAEQLGFRVFFFFEPIEKAPKIREITLRSFQPGHIHEFLKRLGPASLGVSGELGGHQIVLDKVTHSEKHGWLARIRDPWHGWVIYIPWLTLMRRFLFPGFFDQIIQVST